MLFTLQRYEFFSKSQLSRDRQKPEPRCCLPYKGTNFSANHNRSRISTCALCDVVYPTKVRIFQQITTKILKRASHHEMLFTLQRYEFFSKSQQFLTIPFFMVWCCLPYKGTNFSANHNYDPKPMINRKMLFTLQRYEFFSKSQLPLRTNKSGRDVVYPTKVRIFQQITTPSG